MILRNRVLLIAYLKNNLGDDIFVSMLCERYPQVRFITVGTKEFKGLYSSIDNLSYISINNIVIKMVLKIACVFDAIIHKRRLDIYYMMQVLLKKWCKFTVIIGGSMFIENKTWYKRYKMDTAIIDNNTFIIGCNFGPYEDKHYLKKYRELLSKAKDVSFRDTYSFSLFSNNNNARVNPDLVFGYDSSRVSDMNILDINNYVVVSLIDLSTRVELKEYISEYEKHITDLVERLTEKSIVVLMSFCDLQGDKNVAKRIAGNVKSEMVRVYSHKKIELSLRLIKGADLIYATRFHAMILGFFFNIPTIPIVYDEKMTNVLKDIRYSGRYIDLNNMDDIHINFEEIENINISECSKNAINHFKLLDIALGDE